MARKKIAPAIVRCGCPLEGVAFDGPRICPIKGCSKDDFQGKGWEGIDSHWRSLHREKHGGLDYDGFLATLCDRHRHRLSL